MDARGLRTTVLLTLLACLAGAAMFVLVERVEEVVLFGLVLILFLLGAVPIGLRVSRGRGDLFEAFNPYFMIFFIWFGIGTVLTRYVRDVAHDPTIIDFLNPALALNVLGFGMVLLGYLSAERFVRPRLGGPGARPGVPLLTILYSIGLLGGFTFSFVEQQRYTNIYLTAVTSLVTQFAFLATFVTFYVLYLLFADRASPAMKLLLFGWIVPTTLLVLFLRVGSKTALVVAIAQPIIAYWYARKRLAWKTLLALGVVFVLIVFPLYYAVRSVRSGGSLTQAYRIEKSVETLGRQERGDYLESTLLTVARRISLINSTAAILRDAGERVPWNYGKDIWVAVEILFIPRILWPDKPSSQMGLEFAKTFRMTRSLDPSLLSLTMVGDLYWNFALPGVVIGMLVMGAWLWALYARFGANRGADPMRLAVYVTLLMAAMESEASIGSYMGVLVRNVIILLLIEKALLYVAGSADRRLEGAGVPTAPEAP